MAGMGRIFAVIPWPIYVLAMLAVAVFSVARNSFKLRKELGKTPTPDEIRDRYPKAKVFTLWRPKLRR
jgi:hypothetical protein